MRTYIVEINAKLISQSDADPEDYPEDIYAQLSEFLPSDDQLLDLEVATFALPDKFCGSSNRSNDSDAQETGQT